MHLLLTLVNHENKFMLANIWFYFSLLLHFTLQKRFKIRRRLILSVVTFFYINERMYWFRIGFVCGKCSYPSSTAITSDIGNGNFPISNDIGKSRTGRYRMAYIFSNIGRYRHASDRRISACVGQAYIGMHWIDLYRHVPIQIEVNYRCWCTDVG